MVHPIATKMQPGVSIANIFFDPKCALDSGNNLVGVGEIDNMVGTCCPFDRNLVGFLRHTCSWPLVLSTQHWENSIRFCDPGGDRHPYLSIGSKRLPGTASAEEQSDVPMHLSWCHLAVAGHRRAIGARRRVYRSGISHEGKRSYLRYVGRRVVGS